MEARDVRELIAPDPPPTVPTVSLPPKHVPLRWIFPSLHAYEHGLFTPVLAPSRVMILSLVVTCRILEWFQYNLPLQEELKKHTKK
ncbi:MAG TPA: hypothetical protein VL485_11620 [Ktedonobacteraceae bacterium]|jgi:hypothetical protein|nr:hypothetical protein [Ktedonobacteraceae bacterium]